MAAIHMPHSQQPWTHGRWRRLVMQPVQKSRLTSISGAPENQPQGGHIRLSTIPAHEPENRDRYTLTHLHAKGGMGRVWLARDTSLGRQIALKELRPDQTDNSIVFSRFLYEAKITAQLEHPGIVPVYELGEGDSAVLYNAVCERPHAERGNSGFS